MPSQYPIKALDTISCRVTKFVLAPPAYLRRELYLDIQPSLIFFHSSPESHSPLGHQKGAQESCWGLQLPTTRDQEVAERPGSGSLSRPTGDLVNEISLGLSEMSWEIFLE